MKFDEIWNLFENWEAWGSCSAQNDVNASQKWNKKVGIRKAWKIKSKITHIFNWVLSD
jgi:hypothetical protein